MNRVIGPEIGHSHGTDRHHHKRFLSVLGQFGYLVYGVRPTADQPIFLQQDHFGVWLEMRKISWVSSRPGLA